MQRKAALPSADATPLVRDEYTRLPGGRIAAVVTHLHMHARPRLRPEPGAERFSLQQARKPELGWYRDLYRRVGENWLWFSRLVLDDATLSEQLHDPGTEIYALRFRGRDEGILELDFRRFPELEISFLGVVDTLIGTGAGRFLMNRALEVGWARNPRRVTVHTCTFDHPNALAFYLRSGFVPYARSIEVADDPRLLGILPRDAAPHVPIVERE